MATVPMKSEYGPTLGRLLAPRWWAASRTVRAVVAAVGVALVAVAVGVALTLENAHYSHGGKVPFSFQYRGLYRTRPDPGGLVKIVGRGSDGALKYSYEVYPLKLAPYPPGALWGELPIYATHYIATLARSEPDFVLSADGKTKITSTLLGYHVLYTTEVQGRQMYGRNVLLLPERPGAREGVIIAMLTATTASSQIKAPNEVASTGVLLRPLKTFTFG